MHPLTQADMDILKAKIRHVPDFPKPGILFYDITTLLSDPAGFRLTMDSLSTRYADEKVDLVVGIESRGFILGAAVADRLGAGFAPIRKPGKLPGKAFRESFNLEYGSDSLEMHEDAIRAGQRVLIVDDVLATGGTAAAAANLVRRCRGDLLGLTFLIELVALNGRAKLPNESVYTVLKY
jgi:adenine phosphoribosyltransferase